MCLATSDHSGYALEAFVLGDQCREILISSRSTDQCALPDKSSGAHHIEEAGIQFSQETRRTLLKKRQTWRYRAHDYNPRLDKW